MKKLIALAFAALVTVVSTPAQAEMPCEGSSSTCSWTCSTDGQGNIVNYSVACGYGDWCVGADGSVDFGLCSVAPPAEDPVIAALEELILVDEAVDGGTCEVPPKATYSK